MHRFRKHAELGWRWIRCGWRLFLRNPWRLGGMGFCCAALAITLAQLPLFGGPILGLLAPTLLASFYIAIEEISKQKINLPPALRLFAIKQSPREFLNVARDETRLLQIVVMGLYGFAVVVLADIIVWLVAGTASAGRVADFHISALPGMIVAALLFLATYLLLAASLIYAVPLVMLRHEPLFPALVSSLRSSVHYVFALLVILVPVVGVLILSTVVALRSPVLATVGGLAGGSLVLPIVICSIYCSYRTVFAVAAPSAPVRPPLRNIRDVV